jgi:hypothetical protein
MAAPPLWPCLVWSRSTRLLSDSVYVAGDSQCKNGKASSSPPSPTLRGVVFKPFADPAPAAPLGLAWRPADVSAPLRQLVAIARKLASR